MSDKDFERLNKMHKNGKPPFSGVPAEHWQDFCRELKLRESEKKRKEKKTKVINKGDVIHLDPNRRLRDSTGR